MVCRVNWRRFMTRQRVLKRKLATDCGCDNCKKILKTMDNTDKVMEANERNRTKK